MSQVRHLVAWATTTAAVLLLVVLLAFSIGFVVLMAGAWVFAASVAIGTAALGALVGFHS